MQGITDLPLDGEEQPFTEARQICLGGLEAVCDGLSLRWLSLDGVELLRGIGFVVRDDKWHTPHFEAMRITRFPVVGGVGLCVTGRADLPPGRLDCSLDITLTERTITLAGKAKAVGAVKTNRTGFAILYPETAAGKAVRVLHGEGGQTDGMFPELISPHQPFFDIREIHHRPAPHIALGLRMEGDTFEMEDQRNWSDASFKVYSRPLADPFPYTIDDGLTVHQSIVIKLDGPPHAVSSRGVQAPIEISVEPDAMGALPRLGLGGRAEGWHLSPEEQEALARLRPSLIMAELDLASAIPDLSGIENTARGLGLKPTLLARLPKTGGVNALHALAAKTKALDALALSEVTAAELEAARQMFPGIRIGVGTGGFFAEFNRVPPPRDGDFAFWTVNPTVHADDDASVMETLRVLPLQAATARRHLPSLPLWCGPITFRRRGDFARANTRFPQTDDRQWTPFGAAFTLGQISRWAAANVETLIFYQPCGPLGVISRAPAPTGAEVSPIYRLLQALSDGGRLQHVVNSSPARLAALGVNGNLWLANLTPGRLRAEIHIADKAGRQMQIDRQGGTGEASNADEKCRVSGGRNLVLLDIEAYEVWQLSYDSQIDPIRIC